MAAPSHSSAGAPEALTNGTTATTPAPGSPPVPSGSAKGTTAGALMPGPSSLCRVRRVRGSIRTFTRFGAAPCRTPRPGAAATHAPERRARRSTVLRSRFWRANSSPAAPSADARAAISPVAVSTSRAVSCSRSPRRRYSPATRQVAPRWRLASSRVPCISPGPLADTSPVTARTSSSGRGRTMTATASSRPRAATSVSAMAAPIQSSDGSAEVLTKGTATGRWDRRGAALRAAGPGVAAPASGRRGSIAPYCTPCGAGSSP